jgi:hypothetical protein
MVTFGQLCEEMFVALKFKGTVPKLPGWTGKNTKPSAGLGFEPGNSFSSDLVKHRDSLLKWATTAVCSWSQVHWDYRSDSRF